MKKDIKEYKNLVILILIDTSIFVRSIHNRKKTNG